MTKISTRIIEATINLELWMFGYWYTILKSSMRVLLLKKSKENYDCLVKYITWNCLYKKQCIFMDCCIFFDHEAPYYLFISASSCDSCPWTRGVWHVVCDTCYKMQFHYALPSLSLWVYKHLWTILHLRIFLCICTLFIMTHIVNERNQYTHTVDKS